MAVRCNREQLPWLQGHFLQRTTSRAILRCSLASQPHKIGNSLVPGTNRAILEVVLAIYKEVGYSDQLSEWTSSSQRFVNALSLLA